MLRKQTNSLLKSIKQIKFYGSAAHSHGHHGDHHHAKDPNAPPTLKEQHGIGYDDHHTPYTDFDGRFGNESVKK
jgi:hypothetical protein